MVADAHKLHRADTFLYASCMSSQQEWVEQLRGRFVVFDGPDGSGKSTQAERFVDFVASAGVEVHRVREPGGTSIGEQVRAILLDSANDDIDPRCEMLLYMASRAQLVHTQIQPALERGALVLADRFISSTLAYQGAAGGMDPKNILSVGAVAVGDCWPHLVVIFSIDEQTAAQRITGKPNRKKNEPFLIEPGLFSDRIEIKGQAYHQAVRRGYLQQAKNDPSKHLVIDAATDADQVFEALIKGVKRRAACF